MRHAIDKRRDMARSILPSTAGPAYGRGLAAVKRAARRKYRQQLTYATAVGELERFLDRLDPDGYPDRLIRELVRGRRAADRLNHFERWAVAVTAGLPVEDRLSTLRALLPSGLIGDHAISHLVHLPQINPHARHWGEWFARAVAARSRELPRRPSGSHRVFDRAPRRISRCGPESARRTVRRVSTPRRFTERVPVDEGAALHCDVVGDGREAMLVTNSCFLNGDLDPLADDRTLIFIDSRGRGWSDPVTDLHAYGAEDDVDDLEKVRRHFGLERVSVLGWSAGGRTAVSYAHDHADVVDRVVTVGWLPPRHTPPDPDLVAAARAKAEARVSPQATAALAALEAEGVDRSDPARFRYHQFLAGVGRQAAKPELVALTRSPFWECPNEWGDGWMALLRYLAQSPRRPRREAIDRPWLAVYGAEEPNPIGRSRDWRWDLPLAHLLVMEGVGHFPWLEDPARFFTAVDTFLRGDVPDSTESMARPT